MTDQPKISDDVMEVAQSVVSEWRGYLVGPGRNRESLREDIAKVFRDFVRVPEGVKYRDYIKLADREKRLEDLLRGISAIPAIEYVIGTKLNDEIRIVLAEQESKT